MATPHEAHCFVRIRTGRPADPGSGFSCGLPFFKNFYAGGPGSVRGFSANTLGPTTFYGGFSEPQPLGGPVKTIGTFEFYFPQLARRPGYAHVGVRGLRQRVRAHRRFLAERVPRHHGPRLAVAVADGPDLDQLRDPACARKTGDEIERLQFTFGNQ